MFRRSILLITVVVLFLCNTQLVIPQEYNNLLSYWPELIKVDLRKDLTYIYNPSISTLINQKLQAPESTIASFNNGSSKFFIKYASSPANPWLDYLYIENAEGEIFLADKKSKCLCVIGNGSIYAFPPLERNGFRKYLFLEKYSVNGKTIVEIEQPIYLIGKECKANADFQLLLEKDLSSKIVGTIKKDTEIYVIGFYENRKDNKYWYLIKSKIGLIGWHKPFFIDNMVTFSTYSLSLLDANMP